MRTRVSRRIRGLGLAIVCASYLQRALAGETALDGTVRRPIEWQLESLTTYDDPFNAVDVDVVVTAPDGTVTRVPAFWAGGRRWRVRFASGLSGVHRFRSECTDAGNSSLQGIEGTIDIRPIPEGEASRLPDLARH